jgi:hypothetical protein
MTPPAGGEGPKADAKVIEKHEGLAAKIGGTEVESSDTSSAVWMTDGTDADTFRDAIAYFADVDSNLFDPNAQPPQEP